MNIFTVNIDFGTKMYQSRVYHFAIRVTRQILRSIHDETKRTGACVVCGLSSYRFH